MIRRFMKLFALAALLQGGPLEAQGRPLRVAVRNALNFGTLLPGVPTVVPPNDPLNAGEFDLRGRRNSEVLVEFLLPPDLAGPAGASVPLSFGPGSAGYSIAGDIGFQLGFDPGVPQIFALSGNGKVSVFLGGTASPPPNIPAGAYANTVTLLVGYVNN